MFQIHPPKIHTEVNYDLENEHSLYHVKRLFIHFSALENQAVSLCCCLGQEI